MSELGLESSDLEELERRGISRGEAERQLALLRDPPAQARLERPCTVSDGIVALKESDADSYFGDWSEAAKGGRLMKFVPSSGAASRMFKELAALRGEASIPPLPELERLAGEPSAPLHAEAKTAREFVEGLDRFAFRGDLDAQLRASGDSLEGALGRGDIAAILNALLDESRLGYGACPKGLLPFHETAGETRTAFDEHLHEAASYVSERGGTAQIHYTVSEEHLHAFEARRDRVAPAVESATGTRLDVAFSQQSPSTDTLAIDGEGRPFRDEQGRLVLRPGGHGALIRNLDHLGGDLVLIKNIDNVVPDALREPTIRWKKILTGVAVRLQRKLFGLQARLDRREVGAVEEGLEFVERELFLCPGPMNSRTTKRRRDWLVSRLDRPLRICGVVKNEGEPGGGPFWVQDEFGESTLQIVESASVDLDDPEQTKIWGSSTHFNPVDIVAAIRHRHGESYPLEEFVDWDGVFVAKKSSGGRELTALERPGLWNGAMAHWNTVFVEVPLETFSPVKRIVDLLGPAHSV